MTGGCLFNESSLEEVMKSTLTPLTTRLISSEDTRQHAAAFFLWLEAATDLKDRLWIP